MAVFSSIENTALKLLDQHLDSAVSNAPWMFEEEPSILQELELYWNTSAGVACLDALKRCEELVHFEEKPAKFGKHSDDSGYRHVDPDHLIQAAYSVSRLPYSSEA